jgi:hypothetical protein
MASQDICAESQSGCAQSEKSHRFCDDMAATGAESQNSVMVITRSVTPAGKSSQKRQCFAGARIFI